MSGGDGGEVTIGFGGPPAAAQPAKAAQPAVPAFLAPAAVQAVYGEGAPAAEKTEGEAEGEAAA